MMIIGTVKPISAANWIGIAFKSSGGEFVYINNPNEIVGYEGK